jgi:demethylspheroidene O-methyltransferase
MAKQDGAEIFQILQGFVASQVLLALVELRILHRLLDTPLTAANLALPHGIPADRMDRLLRAGVALNLLKRRRSGHYALARKGAAIIGVPGLEAMIQHNRAFYDDLSDPVAFLRSEEETNLQRFWPYVFGQSEGMPRDVAARYSDLMAQSQVLVAKDTLQMVSFKGINRLLDVGGGSGMFLSHVLKKYPSLSGSVLDLPEVLPSAESHLTKEALRERVTLCPGSFRDSALPAGHDAISLIRVLYDHDDASVAALISKVYDALPSGGRLIISEPMSGGSRPDPAGDVYFALYTMAMGTGKARSAKEIAEICKRSGFERIRIPPAPRPFITSALICTKPV